MRSPIDAFLTLLALPLGAALGVGLLALVALALHRRRTAAGLLTFALVWLWAWSTPMAAGALQDSLGRRYPFQRAEALPSAGAIVLLGGGASQHPSAPLHPNLDSASDRAWHAARLHHAGKAPLIIATGGHKWGPVGRASPAEADSALLAALGVSKEAIVIDNRSRNTRENAEFAGKLLAERGIRRVLLTTSVWHMPRAEATFRRAGLDVIPAATDYLPPFKRAKSSLIFRLLPNANALRANSRTFREYLGLLVYRLRGWA